MLRISKKLRNAKFSEMRIRALEAIGDIAVLKKSLSGCGWCDCKEILAPSVLPLLAPISRGRSASEGLS